MIFGAMLKLQFRFPVDRALVIAEIFPGDISVRFPEKNNGPCLVEFFCRSKKDIAQRMAGLKMYMKGGKALPGFRVLRVERKNWAEVWKKNFKPRRISRRIVVKSVWKKYEARKNDCVIEVDPGLAFGTGEHATTAACLGFIDELQRVHPRSSFLDAGCGSGILAIAAAKLGFAPITAIDSDPLAVKVARANMARNNVADQIFCRDADVLGFKSGQKYHVIAANLFSNVLINAAAGFAGLLEKREGACLILSGILVRQYPAVAAAFRREGLREVKTISSRGWRTAVFGWNRAF